MIDKLIKNYDYSLGVFIAKTILNGIFNPDIKIENLGFRDVDNSIVFCDYANVKRFSIPEDINPDLIRKLSICLCPLLYELNNEDSFLEKSYFRAGFTTQGGILCQMIFQNLIDFNFSSKLFIENTPKNYLKNFDLSSEMNTDFFLKE